MHEDWIIGGVYVAPFVGDLVGALIILLLLRRVLARIRLGDLVANAPLAEAGIFVCILTVLVLVV